MSISRGALLSVMSATGLVRTALAALTALIATLILGPAERGVMVVGLTLCSVVVVAAGLGTGSGLRSLLPGATPGERRGLLAGYGTCSVAAAAIAGSAAVGAAVLSAPAVDDGLSDPLFLVGIGTYALAAVGLQQATDLWFADGRLRAGSVGALLATVGGLVGMAVGAAGEISAGGLLAGQAAGTLVVGAGLLPALNRAGLIVVARPTRVDLARLIRRGLPALGLTAGLVVALRADRYILGLTAGTVAVGVYSLAATFAEVARTVPIAAGQMFLRDAAVGDGAARLRRAGLAAAVGAGLAGAAVVVVSVAVLVPVFGPEFVDAPGLLVVLVVAEVFFAPFFVTSRGLVGGGWTIAAGVLGAIGGLVAIGAYLVVTGPFGAAGAAVASVVVYAGLSIASALLLRARFAASSRVGQLRG